MTIGLGMDLRNTRLQRTADVLDAQASAGHLLIYKGTRPATGAAATPTDLLADLPLARPVGSIENAVLTITPPDDTNATGTGVPTWARLTDANGNYRIDGNVGITGSGALVEMEEDSGNPGYPKSIIEGGLVIVTSASLTEGNP